MQRERLANRRFHESIDFTHLGLPYTAGIGYYADGRVAEIFLSSTKSGTAVETNARDGAILVSLVLQHGVLPGDVRRVLTRDARGMPMGPVGAILDMLAEDQAS